MFWSNKMKSYSAAIAVNKNLQFMQYTLSTLLSSFPWTTQKSIIVENSKIVENFGATIFSTIMEFDCIFRVKWDSEVNFLRKMPPETPPRSTGRSPSPLRWTSWSCRFWWRRPWTWTSPTWVSWPRSSPGSVRSRQWSSGSRCWLGRARPDPERAWRLWNRSGH